LHDAALDAATAAVNQPHFIESGSGGRVDVLLDNRWNIARRERVQIQFALDRDLHRAVGHRPQPLAT
jgi:hypothetical protein